MDAVEYEEGWCVGRHWFDGAYYFIPCIFLTLDAIQILQVTLRVVVHTPRCIIRSMQMSHASLHTRLV
jgi:hypothetical protein